MPRAQRPDVFVAIDFPDFNFRLMAGIRALGIPVVYYISPQLWAWRPRPHGDDEAHVDRVLVIFPFEADIYERAGVPVEFVGHPLVELTPPASSHAMSPASGSASMPGTDSGVAAREPPE